MNIYVLGVNYKTSPLEIREKLSLNIEEQKKVLEMLRNQKDVTESAVLSTCNRTELHLYSESGNLEHEAIEKFLCEFKQLDIYSIKKYFYSYKGMKAVKHILKVAAGMDSMVQNEDQILGQFKASYEVSLEAGASLVILNTLSRIAITASKKIKTFVIGSKNPTSTASLSGDVLMDMFDGNLKDKCALIIGSGKVGTLALKDLNKRGIKKLYATKRNMTCEDIKYNEKIDIQYVNYNDRYSIINGCDAVISATSSPHYTITKDMLDKSISDKTKKRIFIDLAVPRDFDSQISQIENIVCLNIDDLKEFAGEHLETGFIDISAMEKIVDEFANEFEKWYRFRDFIPVIMDMNKFTDNILQEKITTTMKKLNSLCEEDKEIVKASMTNAVNTVLNKFIYSIKEYSNSEDLETYFRCIDRSLKEK